jgi:hypothetical protein
MYLEGCKWEYVQHQLDESDPKKLFTDIPLILLVPEVDKITPKDVIFDLFYIFLLGNLQLSSLQGIVKSRYPIHNWSFN